MSFKARKAREWLDCWVPKLPQCVDVRMHHALLELLYEAEAGELLKDVGKKNPPTQRRE